MSAFYKAVRPNGRDFWSDTVQWAPEKVKARKGRIVKHPGGELNGTAASTYLSVSTVPTDCTGMRWPCRLLEVEPVGESWAPHPHDLPNKRAALAFRVIREVDARQVFGPQADQLVALIEWIGRLTRDEASRLDAAGAAAGYAARAAARDAAGDAARYAARAAARYAAWDAARYAARDAARYAARAAAWDAAWGAARYAARAAAWDAAWGADWCADWCAARCAARDAAWALVARDLISTEHYDTLTRPWRTVIGPIHPDDPELTS